MDDKLEFLVEQFQLDEIFDMLDISPQEVLRILVEGGHVELPPFLEESFNG